MTTTAVACAVATSADLAEVRTEAAGGRQALPTVHQEIASNGRPMTVPGAGRVGVMTVSGEGGTSVTRVEAGVGGTSVTRAAAG